MGALTGADCASIADVLADAVRSLPATAGALKAQLRVTAKEYRNAAKMADVAESRELVAEIRAVGAIARGEEIQFPNGVCEAVRQTESGLLIRTPDGFESWQNYSSKLTPYVVVTVPEQEVAQ